MRAGAGDASVVLALGAGGARGLAQIGVIEVLQERGLRIEAVAGTSCGALVGGAFAAGKLGELRDWMLRTGRNEMLRLLDPGWGRPAMFTGNRLVRTAMALEALGDEPASRPAAANAFVATCAQAVQAVAAALRERRAPDALPDLRALQQALLASLRQPGGNAGEAESLIRLSDRLTDNIDTLAHVLRRAHPAAGHA